MFYPDAVETHVLELIRTLQQKEYLSGFYLVGGTALALQLGHRRSVDIDLFSNFAFDAAEMHENIRQDYNYQLFFTAAHTLKGFIDDVVVDIIAHRFRYLKKPLQADGILLLSSEDIIAMKLNAISTSGQRSKDFIDIYYLLEKYDISSMLEFYRTKYGQKNDMIILKSLVYFNDVDLADWPVLLKDPGLRWSDVKKCIQGAVEDYWGG